MLGLLVALAITLPIVYNLGQQLRPDQLAVARLLWDEHGPADYDLTFTIQYDGEPLPERHIVLVRQGRAVAALREGELLAVRPALGAMLGLPAGAVRGPTYTIPTMFDRLQALLEEENAQRNFLVGVFDPQSGWPRRFIRRVRRQTTREEWNLRLWPAGHLTPSPRQ